MQARKTVEQNSLLQKNHVKRLIKQMFWLKLLRVLCTGEGEANLSVVGHRLTGTGSVFPVF